MSFIKQMGILFLLFLSIQLKGQEFSIKKVELTMEGILLHYDLLDTARGHTYTISLFTSTNNYSASAVRVKGDIGLQVRPGSNKKILWNAKEELGATFNGDIEMEIRGRVYIPFIKFDGFQEEQVIKRGKPKTITWSGGNTRNLLTFTLYKKIKEEDTFVEVFTNIPNTGSYDIVLPRSVGKGSGYYFLIADAKNKDQAVRTSSFRVKPKVPLIVKLLPVAVIGAAVYLLLPGSGTKDMAGPPELPPASN